MPDITEQEIRAQIKSAMFKRVYLVFGNEDYLKRFYVGKIAERAVEDLKDMNLTRFDGNVRMDELETEVMTLPMMSEHRCVIVCDYNFASADCDQERVVKMINDIPDTTVLVLWYDSVDINLSKIKKIVAAVRQNGCVLELNKKSENELSVLISKRAAQSGCILQPTTARQLIANCGNDLSVLFNEIDKICSYVGSGGITSDDIELLSVKTIDVSVFALAGAVCECRTDKAFGILNDLFEAKEEPIAILGVLSNAFSDMYRARIAENAGIRPEHAAAELGYSEKMAFRLKNGSRNARNISTAALRKCLEHLKQTDIKLKTTSADGKTAIEKLIVMLVLEISQSTK